jgi:hypothetical protein
MIRFLGQRGRSEDEEVREKAPSFVQYLFIETVEEKNIQALLICK